MKITDHLLIPFGRPKWSIEKIRIVGVSTGGTFFESEGPLAHVDRSKKVALRLRDFVDLVPGDFGYDKEDPGEALAVIRTHLRQTCELDTDSERRFLDLYFAYCEKAVTPSEWELKYYERKNLAVPKNDPLWVFDALLPLPQAHLYLEDPLSTTYSFVPEKMVKVDFAFWTGERLVAVEIDGSSHIGSEQHIRKDRMLQRAGVSVVHILNGELLQHGEDCVRKLLPTAITQFWQSAESKYRINPLSVPF
ncbi:MAG: endonuclease domain-containing protein [Vicinamibacteria bacterium]|nr:endonuclease domain-containing protein [Vicinamibacteria bacterium]